MIRFDAHCDTISRILLEGGDLEKNSYQLDLKRLKAKNHVQMFAAFIEPEFYNVPLKYALRLIDRLHSEIAAHSDYISFCTNINEISNTTKSGKTAALLSIEGGEALLGDLACLRMLYKLGVRSICLTWNHKNEIATGATSDEADEGLTEFGRSVVLEMNRLGMLIDLSHISEKGFWDVMHITKSPVIVSHSNARSVCDHKRNLYDDQLNAVKENGGVVGINFYPYFLNQSGDAELKDIIKHIEHMSGLMGIDHIGIGSDFDGIEKTPVDICGVEDLDNVINALLKLNYSNAAVEKIAGLNFLRVIEEVLV